MQELRLVAVSEDGTYLVLATAGRGTRFTLPVDDRLRAAVRGHFSRLGQFEIEVESPLRPKEIQARIRSGETAEEIAESAGIPVERVRWFEGPVLQEREYMAQQAQRVAVRRPGESTPGPPLGETVEERLGRGGVDLEEVEWDSWKCEDNTWRVRLSFFDNGRPHAAEWTFDPRRRHVSPLDEIAARLTAAEWDDEPLSDTVTPLVPRRPAMKVVSSDRDTAPAPRDPAPRGLPAEPEPSEQAARLEQPPVREPLRAAEPRDHIAEAAVRAEPPAPFRQPGEPTALREAARPPEPEERPEPAVAAPAPLRPAEAPVPVEAVENVENAAPEAEEEARPREAAPADEVDETREPATESAPASAEEATDREDVDETVAEQDTGDAEEDEQEQEASGAEPRRTPDPAPPEPAAAEPAAAETAAETAVPEPAEDEKPVRDRKPAAAQRPGQRQSPRPPAKKKPAARPAMPAAAQDKPATGTPAAAATGGEPAAPRPARRRKSKGKRASVPSWDEIMFGARRPE